MIQDHMPDNVLQALNKSHPPVSWCVVDPFDLFPRHGHQTNRGRLQTLATFIRSRRPVQEYECSSCNAAGPTRAFLDPSIGTCSRCIIHSLFITSLHSSTWCEQAGYKSHAIPADTTSQAWIFSFFASYAMTAESMAVIFLRDVITASMERYVITTIERMTTCKL
uniref:Uncharacterized protein n=1 Tax=Timema monikensis TaxID=170555 RepID=A0A7R9EFE7_9NEOP|nr:unnamed protein product [Timema monikensis]